MATRFYLPSTGAAPVSVSFDLTWDETSGAGSSLKCVTTKISSAMTSVAVTKTTATGGTRALVRQYVSDRLVAQTLASGTTFTGQIRALESAANDNLDVVSVGVFIVSQEITVMKPGSRITGRYR